MHATSHPITPGTVRQLLRDLRYDRPVEDSPLLGLALLTQTIAEHGLVDCPGDRSYALRMVIHDLAGERLGTLRREQTRSLDSAGPEAERLALTEDVKSANPQRIRWSLLWSRYLSPNRLAMSDLCTAAGVSERTVRTRVEQAITLLADELVSRELQALAITAAEPRLPTPVGRFVGRESELSELRRLMASHRVVTITGPGGIGKSRLALELARSLASFYPERLWFADLADLDDRADLSQAVARAIGIGQEPGRPLLDTIAEHVADTYALLTLDNCERAYETCGPLVDHLVHTCRGLQVLAASRRALGASDEVVWHAPPLSMPEAAAALPPPSLVHYDATRLFVERAAAAVSGFTLTAANAPHVLGICRHLNGIALAIELAASRLRDVSLADLVRETDSSLVLGGSDQAPTRPHHAALATTMDWSYRRLPERERLLLARVAVFHDGWNLDAAQTVCHDERIPRDIIEDALDELYRNSMIHPVDTAVDPTRYKLLDTVRDFALNRLEEEGDAAAVRAAHARYYSAMAQQASQGLWGREQRLWLSRIGLDYSNFRAAMQWSKDAASATAAGCLVGPLSWYWLRRGHAEEGLGWHDLLRQFVWELGNETAVDAMLGEAFLTAHVANRQRARSITQRALELSEALEYAAGTALAHAHYGVLDLEAGDYVSGISHVMKSVETSRDSSRPEYAGLALFLAGMYTRLRGNPAGAIEYHRRGLQLDAELEAYHSGAWSMADMGAAMRETGDLTHAVASGIEALARFEALDDPAGTASAAFELHRTMQQCGDAPASSRLLHKALRSARRAPHPFLTTSMLLDAASALSMSDRSIRAAEILAAATKRRDEIGAPWAPAESESVEALRRRLQEAHGARELVAATDRGQRMSLREAMARSADEVLALSRDLDRD